MRKDKDIKSKIQTIKTITDNTKNFSENLSDNVIEDLPTTDKLFGKKLDEFVDKRKKKKQNKKDIFTKLNDLAETFISDKKSPRKDKYGAKKKLKKIAQESLKVTVNATKDILLYNITNIFFVGDGICGRDSAIKIDNITLKPSEIDFLNVFSVDPNSDIGKIVYEPESPNINRQKVNRQFYTTFNSSTYNFVTNNNKILFTTNWDVNEQSFNITGLQQNTAVKVEDFFLDYFSSIELPDITGITKNAMILTLQPGNSVNIKFKTGLNDLEKITSKLFAICGNSTDRENIRNQNPVNLFDNTDEDESTYFDFDSTEGFDFSLEDAKFRSVLKFVDCDNFEVPVNENILEDFVFFSTQKNIDDLVEETLEKAASDAYEQSGGNIPKQSFNQSLFNNFIISLPKALVMSVLTPKVFLPVVIIYKMYKSITTQVLQVKDMMKKLYKLFSKVIKDLFWKFIQEYWRRLKIELLKFVKELIAEILKSKYKRYVTILTAIFNLLKKVSISGINNCDNLFDAISKTLETVLASKGGFNIPGFLLGFSDNLPGFSKEGALLNAIQRMESLGIPTGPIYNEDNNIPKIMKSLLDGFFEELDKNSFVKAANKETTIPTPVGPIIIPPGIINVSGKLF